MAHQITTTVAKDLAGQDSSEPGQRPNNLSRTMQRMLAARQGRGGCDALPPGYGYRVLDRLCLTEIETAAIEANCEGDHVAPTVAAWVQISGTARLRQGDRAAELAPGDLCLIRGARPFVLELPEAAMFLLVEAPEQELADRFRSWRYALLKAIQATSGVPAVFQEAVQSIWYWCDDVGSDTAESIANALIDLIGAMICFAAPSNPDCLNRALNQREQILRFARAQLRNPDLNVELIAEAVGLSPRHVHRLFADEEFSLMRWIWSQRLKNCYRELHDARAMAQSISSIAYSWGFNDQAHFSRAFRKQFGVSPRQVRSQATAEAPDAPL